MERNLIQGFVVKALKEPEEERQVVGVHQTEEIAESSYLHSSGRKSEREKMALLRAQKPTLGPDPAGGATANTVAINTIVSATTDQELGSGHKPFCMYS